ncbi:hypothetical protein F4604DRAFT_1724898, partial [Suillus subluteus]
RRAGSHCSCICQTGWQVCRLTVDVFGGAALCLLKPAAHMGFYLTRMLARTKSDNGHMGARPTSILILPGGCALYSMSFFTPFYITPSTLTYRLPNLRDARSKLPMA